MLPHSRVPASRPVAVAPGGAHLAALAVAGADLRRDLAVHDRLGEHGHRLAQEIDVSSRCLLAEQLQHVHALCDHRRPPPRSSDLREGWCGGLLRPPAWGAWSVVGPPAETASPPVTPLLGTLLRAAAHGLHDWRGEVVIRHGATFVPVVNGPHEVKLPDGTSHGVLVTNVNTFSRTWGVETTVTLRGSGGPSQIS